MFDIDRALSDNQLTIEAIGILLYLENYAKNRSQVTPSRKRICSDLAISKNRFHKHLNLLILYGYLTVGKKTIDASKYPLNHYKPCTQNQDTIKEGQFYFASGIATPDNSDASILARVKTDAPTEFAAVKLALTIGVNTSTQ